MDKMVKILGRYISKVYPELLSGNLIFYKITNIYRSDSMFIGHLYRDKTVLYIHSEYNLLIDLFGEDLFLDWFNREHYKYFINRFGDDFIGRDSIVNFLIYDSSPGF